MVIAVSYIHPLTSYRHAQQEVRDRQAAITALERDNTELTKKLMDAGKSDYVIREARRLGLVRDGEHLFIVKGRRDLGREGGTMIWWTTRESSLGSSAGLPAHSGGLRRAVRTAFRRLRNRRRSELTGSPSRPPSI